MDRLRCGQGSGLTQKCSTLGGRGNYEYPRTQFTLNSYIISERCIVQCIHLPIAEMTFPYPSKIRIPIEDVSRSNR